MPLSWMTPPPLTMRKVWVGIDSWGIRCSFAAPKSLLHREPSATSLHQKADPPRPQWELFPLLTNSTQKISSHPTGDSLYTQTCSAGWCAHCRGVTTSTQTEPPPAKCGDAEDVYYKSMPNLGSRNPSISCTPTTS